MPIAIPEKNKKAGVFYAMTDDGLELPVIDVTHPAFAIEISQSELDRRLQTHMREVERRSRMPAFVQNFVLRMMMRRSRLMRALSGAAGGFLGGMDTYILKLGPDNMDNSFASSIDRRISASLPGLSVRLRLQDHAHLLADGLLSALRADPKSPLHLLNIGGGPAIDSLNALIILRKSHPELLADRPVFIHILDLDEAGPNFGRRALEALQAEGAPLHGLEARFQRVQYDWSEASGLSQLLESFSNGAVSVAASSEGALFEYGSDQVITANLQALHAGAPPNALMVGSVTRADTTGRLLNGSSRAALQMRGLEAFTALAQRAGWYMTKRVDRPSGHDVCLTKAVADRG